jgi:hypothetical protein
VRRLLLQARAAVRCAVEADVRVVVLLLVNEWRAARAEDLLLKLEATTAMLVKYYNKVDEHWFDQTVSI